jgi:hypothetical protein
MSRAIDQTWWGKAERCRKHRAGDSEIVESLGSTPCCLIHRFRSTHMSMETNEDVSRLAAKVEVDPRENPEVVRQHGVAVVRRPLAVSTAE